MKKTVITIFALIILIIGTSGVLALNGYFTQGSGQAGKIDSADTTRGLVGYWNFDEGTGQTTNDSSDSNNDGTLGVNSSVGTDDPKWTTGPSTGSGQASGGALDFDGSNDFVSIADSASITLTAEYTISHWVKGDVVPGSASITQTISKADRNYNFSWSHTNASFRQACALHDGAWKSVGITSTLSANTWYYIVCRKDSSTLKVFLNGIEEGSTAVGTPTTPAANLTIGSGITTGGTPESFFDGQIDEPRIYNRALSASEIRMLYNHGGPVAHYKMDEGSGTTAYDATNITNDGTITGATYTNGKFGTALNFDGSDDVVTVTNANPIDFDVGLNDAVTFSSWIRADNAGEGTGGQIVFKGTNTWLRVDTLSSGRLDLEASIDLATTDATLNTSQTITQSTWHHVVMTYTDDSDDEIELYVDGILVGTSTNGDGAPAATDTNNLLIAGTTTNNFDGLIDDVRVFGYARTPEEIRLDYNAGLAAKFGGSPNQDINRGLVGYWDFSEGTGQTANDASDSNNDGTLGANSSVGTDDPIWTTGKSGNGGALDFDGTNDVVNIPNSASLQFNDTNDLTVSLWMRPNVNLSSTSGRTPFAIKPNVWALEYDVSVAGGCGDGTLNWRMSNTCESGDVEYTTTFTAGQWYHIVGTRIDSTNALALYLNGVLVGSGTKDTGDSTNAVEVGAYVVGAVFANVDIDEVRIYNRALSSSEIRYLYNRGGPVAHYKFDEGSGTTTYESSGNGNGTAGNISWVQGKLGTALEFKNSPASFVNISNASSRVPTDVGTASVWIYRKFADSVSFNRFVYRIRADTNHWHWFEYDSTSDQWEFYVESGGFPDGTNSCSLTPSTIPQNEWHHVAVTWDATSDRQNCYVDGVLVQANTVSLNAWVGGVPGTTAIGSDEEDATGGGAFDGLIDDFRFYNYARTPEEIRLDYNAGLAAKFGGSPNQDINRGLVGYWDFSEGTGQTANDASDSNNDGTLGANSSVGTDDPKWTTSKAGLGGALDFLGVNDEVRVADSSSLSFTNNIFAIAFWMLPSDNTGVDGVIAKQTGGGSGFEYGIWDNNPNQLKFATWNSGGSSVYPDIDMLNVVASEWVHFVYTADGSTASVYRNGVLQTTVSKTANNMDDTAGPLKIGLTNIGGVDQFQFMNGKLDDVRIYNRALSAAEIRYLYNRGGPVAHYKFDEGSGSTAFDSTDITNDGTITGATYTTGKYGTALNFDGSDDVVTVTNANPIDFDVGLNDAVTFSSWIRADNAGEGTGGQIVFKGTNTWLRVDTLSSGRLDLEASIDLATTDATLNTSQTITQSTWHHVVMTYTDDSDDEIELYVDGILVGTSTNGDGAPAGTDTNNLLIAGTTTNNFDGLIDDARVYHYALTVDQVKQSYNAGLGAHFR